MPRRLPPGHVSIFEVTRVRLPKPCRSRFSGRDALQRRCFVPYGGQYFGRRRRTFFKAFLLRLETNLIVKRAQIFDFRQRLMVQVLVETL